MTLILTLSTPLYVLQVSDRLVTQSGVEFDPLSNKNVIYQTNNAIVTMGYTGHAYFDGTLTDQFLAETLWGETITDEFTLRMSTAPAAGRDLGGSMEALRTEHERVFRLLPKDGMPRQQVAIGGWQWKRGRARPICAVLTNDEDKRRDFKVELLDRYWHYRRHPIERWRLPFRLSVIPEANPLSQKEVDRLMTLIGSCLRSPDLCEDFLIRAIRLAADRTDVIGKHCMSVLLPPPLVGQIRVRYVPAEATVFTRSFGGVHVVAPGAFSPWVVSPNLLSRPAVVIGGQTIQTNRFSVVMQAPPVPPGSGIITAFHRQKRRPYPG